MKFCFNWPSGSEEKMFENVDIHTHMYTDDRGLPILKMMNN